MRSSRHVSGSVSEGGGRDGLRPNEVGSAYLMKFSVCKKKREKRLDARGSEETLMSAGNTHMRGPAPPSLWKAIC